MTRLLKAYNISVGRRTQGRIQSGMSKVRDQSHACWQFGPDGQTKPYIHVIAALTACSTASGHCLDGLCVIEIKSARKHGHRLQPTLDQQLLQLILACYGPPS